MSEQKLTTEARDVEEVRPERRVQHRGRCRSSAFALFAVPPNLRCFRVPIWDASRAGISLLHDVPLEPQTILALQLRPGLPGISWIRTAHVIHARPHEGKWLIGCRVSPPLSERELEDLR